MGKDQKTGRLTAIIEWDGKTKVVGFGVWPESANREAAESGAGEEQHENARNECKDKVQEASEESFPASDPPSYNP